MVGKRRPETGISQTLQRLDIESSRTTQSEMDLTSRLARARSDEAKAYDAVQRNTSLSLAQKYAKSAEQRSRIEQQLQTEQEQRVQGQWERTGSALQRSVLESSVRSDVAAARGSDAIRANRLASDPKYDVAQVRSSVQQRLDQVRSTISSIGAAGVFSEEERAKVAGAAKQYQSLVQQMAVVQDVERVKRREGTDEQGIIGRARENISRYREAREGVAIAGGVAAGSYGSIGDIRKKSSETSAKLEAAERELENTLTQETARRRELLKTIDGLNKETAENEKIMKEMAKQGGGRGGQLLGKIGAGLQIGGQVLGTIADVTQYGLVQSKIEQLQVRTGYADLTNQKYNDIKALASGDMAAQLRIAGQAYGAAAGFGNDLKATTVATARGGQIATGLTAAGSLATEVALASATGGASLAMTQGNSIGVAAGAASNIAKTEIGLQRGVVQGNVDLQANMAYLGHFNSINAVKADQMQQYRDSLMNYAGAARGMGGGTRGAMEMMTGSLRGELAGADYGGLTIENQQQLYSALKRQTGAAIEGGRGAEAMRSAGSLYAKGYLESPEQYAGLMSKMTAAGGGNRETIDAIKAAVAAGLDSSKNIEQVVAGISSLASASASTGFTTTGATTKNIAGMMMAMESTGMDKNLIAGAAMSSYKSMNEGSGGWGYDMQTLLKTQTAMELGVQTKNLPFVSGLAVDQLQEMKRLSKGDAKERRQAKAMIEQTHAEDLFDKDLNWKKSSDRLISSYKVANQMEGLLATQGGLETLQKGYSGTTPTAGDEDVYGRAVGITSRGQANYVGAKAWYRGDMDKGKYAKRTGDIDAPATGNGLGLLDTVNKAQSVQAIAGIGQVEAGGSQLDKEFGGLNKLVTTMTETFTQMNKQGMWEKMAASAEAASKTMSTGPAGIDGTINKLDSALGRTVDRLEAWLAKAGPTGFVGSNAPADLPKTPGTATNIQQNRPFTAEDRKGNTWRR